MEVVDPALQRDGEVDEILRAPSEQHVLRSPQPAQADPQQGDRREHENGHGRRGECDPEGEAHGAASEKITGNSALLFALFVSPWTGSTAT